jgi:hypothetical protein
MYHTTTRDAPVKSAQRLQMTRTILLTSPIKTSEHGSMGPEGK